MTFASLLTKQNLMLVILGILVVAIIYSVIRAQMDKRFEDFNLFDVLMATDSDGVRRVNHIRTSYMIVLLVSTWIVFDMEVQTKGHPDNLIFGAWLTAFVVPIVSYVLGVQKAPPVVPPKKDGE